MGRPAQPPILTAPGDPLRWHALMVEATAAVGVPRSSLAVLARNISVLAGSQVVTWAATALWTLAVPRALGARETGLYTLGVASGGVLTVLIGFGMRPLLVREIAADPRRGPQLVGTSIALRGLVAVPMLVATVLFARAGGFDHDQQVAICLGWGMCIFYVLYEPVQAAFQAIQRMRYLAYADMLTKGAVSVGAIGLVLLGVRAAGLLIASTAVMAAVLALHLVWMRGVLRIDWRVTPARLRAVFVASLPYWGFAAFFTIYLWIDTLMLAAMTNSTVVGWYGMPTKLFGTLMFVPVILSTAWLPQLVTAFEQGEHTLRRPARTAIETVVVLSLPICVGTVLVADPLVRALYGPGFAEAAPVLAVLALCIPAMYLNIMVNQVLIAQRRQMVWTKVMLLASVVNPAVNLWLIRLFQGSRHNGAIGAAVSMLVTELLIAAIGVAVMRRILDRAMLGRLARALVATAGMIAAALAARPLGPLAELPASGAAFVLLAAALRVVGPEERAALGAVGGTARQRLRGRGRST